MKYIELAIDEHASQLVKSLPESVRCLIAQARSDLYFGPHHEDGYPGFVKALQDIREALSEVQDVYIDESGYISIVEPQAYIDDDGECVEPMQYSLIEAKRILSKMVGAELNQYL